MLQYDCCMKTQHVRLAIALSVTLLACSSDDKTPTTSSSSGSSSGTSGGSSGTSGGSSSGTSGSSGTTAVDPPTIDAVNKMTGVLHVMWTLPKTTCESIEGERKAQMANGSVMEEYKVVFTVPGTTDNKMESTATDDMKYTYRLRCKVGSQYSKYSNEMSGNPKQ